MTSPFKPRLDILPPSQRALWDELSATPAHFTLYGGTALALHLGHRRSIDFDFFSNEPFMPDELLRSISYLRGAKVIDVGKNTLTCQVDRSGWVKLQFFGGLDLRAVEPRLDTGAAGFFVAALLDIAATKIKVLPERSEQKDYLDIDALLKHGMDLSLMLAAAKVVYGQTFNPILSLKAMAYFDDVPGLSNELKTRLIEAAVSVKLDALLVIGAAMQASPIGHKP